MSKSIALNHFLGGSGAGAGGGVLGVKFLSGVWCVLFIELSPTGILLMPIIGALACWVAGAAFAAGTNGCVGVCSVRVMRVGAGALGWFAGGVFFGGVI